MNTPAIKLPSVRDDVPEPILRLWHLPRADVERIYQQAYRRNDRAALRWLGLNDRYFLLTCLLRRADARHDWIYARCREVEADPDWHIDLWARDSYKAVYINEPVPTPEGWRKHGELEPGDKVFAPDGTFVKVVARTQVFTDAPCYRVKFCDGYDVVVSADHLWTVNVPDRSRIDGTNVRKKWKEITVSTSELAEHVDVAQQVPSRRYPVIPVAAAVEYPRVKLPLDPYVLGVWLGDGTRGHPYITVGLQDADEMEDLIKSAGVQIHRKGHSNAVTLKLGSGVRGNRMSSDIANVLRDLGVYQGKFIPRLYLRSSIDQRYALLQGLMDTDGNCAKASNSCVFCSADEELATDVFDLCQSLGIKATIARREPLYRGKARPYWQVAFCGQENSPPFRLRRKAVLCKGKSDHFRQIKSVERMSPRPVSCIQVDRADGQYLIGDHYVATHNSTIITFAGVIQEILRDPEITIGLFSNDKPTAKDFVGQVKRELEDNDFLKSLFSDVLWANPRRDAPWWSLDDGIVVRRQSNPKEATLEPSGLIDGMSTGKHFRLRVYDDVVTEQTVTTSEMIKKVTAQFELSEHLGQKDGRAQIIGTRYHHGDTYGILRQRGIYIERRHPATKDGTFDGEPVFLSPAQWERKKAGSSKATIAAQMLLNPLAGAETTFNIQWVKFWFVRPKRVNVYIMVDPSKGKTATSDNTAIAVIGVDVAQNRYLLDGWCHRMNLSRRWQIVRDVWKRWSRMNGVASVRLGYEQFGMQTDLEYFELQMEREKLHIPIEELSWPRSGPKSKEHRIERLEPDFRMGRLMIPGVVSIDEEGNISPYDPSRKKIVQEALAAQERWRVATPILQINEDERRYDVLTQMFEEYVFFPYAPRDDFLDAMSRIYDLDPVAPIYYEGEPGRPTSTEPPVYMDT